jgi:ABC-type antimicrobial peptide transport system permease subunit
VGAYAFTALGFIAASVAMLGLFSVLAYYVAERQREFAIRIALGAEASRILGIVARQGAMVTVAGLSTGIVVTWYATRWIEPLLYHTALLETWVLGAVSVALLTIAIMASLLSARRAATVDPATIMRAE